MIQKALLLHPVRDLSKHMIITRSLLISGSYWGSSREGGSLTLRRCSAARTCICCPLSTIIPVCAIDQERKLGRVSAIFMLRCMRRPRP